MYCKKCGKELTEGAQFCQFCGEKLFDTELEKTKEEMAGDVPENRRKTAGSSSRSAYLMGVVLGLVIIAVIMLVKVGNRSADGRESVKTESEASYESVEDFDIDSAEENRLIEKTEETKTAIEGGSGVKAQLEEETEQSTEMKTDQGNGAEQIEAERMMVSCIKVTSLLNPEDYEEYMFDEDGDLINHTWHYDGKNGETDYHYLTDEAGNKVRGDCKRQITLLNENTVLDSYENMDFIYGNGIYLLQAIDIKLSTEAEDVDEQAGYVGEVHTKFTYDSQNRLVEVKGAEEYNEVGRALTVTDYTTVYTYQENGGQTEVTRTLNYNNSELDEHPDFTKMVFDEEGRLSRYERNTWQEEGYCIWTSEYEYDSDGRLHKEIYNEHDPIDGDNCSECEYIYDVSGNKVKEISNSGNESIWEYDVNGNKVRFQSYNNSGIWEYDDEGYLTESAIYINNGFANDSIEENIVSYQYDDQRRLVSSDLKVAKGVEKKEFLIEYRYDGQKHLTEVLLNGSAVITANYNDEGELEKLSYNSLKKQYPVNHYIEKELIFSVLPDNMKFVYNPEFPDSEEPAINSEPDLDGREIVIEYRRNK